MTNNLESPFPRKYRTKLFRSFFRLITRVSTAIAVLCLKAVLGLIGQGITSYAYQLSGISGLVSEIQFFT